MPAKLIAARGALMGALPEGGAMVAIEASEEEIAENLPEGLSIAGINAPDSVVVSGGEAAALELAETWKGKGRKTTRLRVSHAFHSELMEPMLDEFAAVAQTISFNPPQIPVLSNLSGELLTPEQATDPAYWVAQVRQPVRFADGASHLAAQGVSTCIELGPDGVLCAMAQGSFAAAEKEAVAVPLLRKDRAESTALLGALAAAQVNGAPLDWARLLPGAKRVPLPTYAFQRQRYWLEPRGGEADLDAAGQSGADHPLLSAAISLPGDGNGDGGWLLTGRLSLQDPAMAGRPPDSGRALLPGTAFVEMALKAAEQVGAAGVAELTLEAPLVLPEPGAVQVQVAVGAADERGSRSIAIHSRADDGRSRPRVDRQRQPASSAAVAGEHAESLAEWPPAAAEPVPVEALYERIADLGIEYGPAFQGVRAAWRRGEELFAEVELDDDQAAQAERFGIHPALLDAAIQPLARRARRTGGRAAQGPLRLEAASACIAAAPPSCGWRSRRPARDARGWRSPTPPGSRMPTSSPCSCGRLRAASSPGSGRTATRSSPSSGPSRRCRIAGRRRSSSSELAADPELDPAPPPRPSAPRPSRPCRRRSPRTRDPASPSSPAAPSPPARASPQTPPPPRSGAWSAPPRPSTRAASC